MNQVSAAHVNYQYISLIDTVLELGSEVLDRTGVGTTSWFGDTSEYKLAREDDLFSVPILTLKKVHIPSVIHELLWMLSGITNIKYLTDNKVRIWNEWADKNGELGPVYGAQWRNFDNSGVDQIKELENSLRNNPKSRRHILSAWNPAQIANMALPPCHMFAQFYIDGKNRLHCQMYQRSADLFLGVPFNILQYSLITIMLARVLDLDVGTFRHCLGDMHIYNNHKEVVDIMSNRSCKYLKDDVLLTMPKIRLPKKNSILDYVYEDFEIVGEYIHHPHLAAPVAV